MKLVAIVRVSTEGQAGEHGEGLERQRVSIQQVAKANGVKLSDISWVEVSGVSGSDLADTPEWNNVVIPALQSGSHIVADALDRIIRADAFDFRTYGTVWSVRGRIYVPGRVYDSNNPQDVFTLTIFAGIGGLEKAEIKRRMNAGKETGRLAGRWVSGRLPKGTSFEADKGGWSYAEPDANMIRRAYHALVTGGESISMVAKALGLTCSGARVALSNTIYKGILRYGRRSIDGKMVNRDDSEVIIRRVFAPDLQLVPDDVWQAAQDIMEKNVKEKRSCREKSAADSYLAGFLSSSLEMTWKADGWLDLDATDINPKHILYPKTFHCRGRVYRRWACKCRAGGAVGLTDCGLKRHRMELVSAAVDEYLRQITDETTFLDSVKLSIGAGIRLDRDQERARLKADLKECEVKESKLTDLLLDDRINREVHDSRQDAIREQRKTIQARIEKLGKEPAIPTPTDVDALAKDWRYDPTWDHVRKREWIRRYVTNIKIANDGVDEVTLRIPVEVTGGVAQYVSRSPLPWAALVKA